MHCGREIPGMYNATMNEAWIASSTSKHQELNLGLLIIFNHLEFVASLVIFLVIGNYKYQ